MRMSEPEYRGWLGADSALRPFFGASIKALKQLTIAEKKARGTHQACLDPNRPLSEVRAEMTEALESLDDMRHNLHESGKAIRQEGVLIDIITRNNAGNEVRTKKLNPACKLQKDMLSAIKSVKRALVLLREEEQIAMRLEKPEHNEFEGLD
jgi:hypothetical protein